MENKPVPIEREGQRVLLTSQLAESYETTARRISENFNANKERYKKGKHFYCLEGDDLKAFKREYGNSVFAENSNKIYLWTERGALLHAKSLNTDKAWEIYEELVETYFRAVKVLNEKKSAKTETQISAETKRANAMQLNAKKRTAEMFQKLWDRANVKPEYQALALMELFAEDGVKLPRIALQGAKVTYDKGTIAEKLGIYSKTSKGGKPHAQAVGAIIAQLKIGEDEREPVPFCRNGHDGTDYQYTESVIEKVRVWLKDNNYPSSIPGSGKNYGVQYKNVG